MSEPNIPVIPSSFPPDQARVLSAMKSCIEILMGQGRTTQNDRAARYGELTLTQNALTDAINSIDTPSGATPDPPTDLTITKGSWVHFLTWVNPEDTIVSHIEIWRATNTQSISSAKLIAIVTVTENLRGEEGNYKSSLEDVTADYTYWIRSISYAGNHSTWEPIESQGGFVVPGDDSVGEAIDAIMSLLKGETPELYATETVYSFNNRCRTSDGRVWKYINIIAGSGNEPPDVAYWERSGILLIGDIDGIPTVGIDGHLVVDGSILARHIQAATINVDHMDTGEAFIGLTIQSADFDADNKTGWQISNNGSKFYNGTFLIGAGSEGYSNFTDKPTSINDINSGEYAALNTFLTSTYPTDKTNLLGLIDGKIDSWYTETDPSLSWTGTDASHEGDMWWNASSGTLKRYTGSAWSAAITDPVAITAYSNAATAQDTADGKRRVFTTTPSGPYDVGDLWDFGSGLRRAIVSRTSGYYLSDWVIVSDVTGNNSAAGLISGADISYAKANGSTLISGGYINTAIIQVGMAQITNLMVQTIHIASEAVTVPIGGIAASYHLELWVYVEAGNRIQVTAGLVQSSMSTISLKMNQAGGSWWTIWNETPNAGSILSRTYQHTASVSAAYGFQIVSSNTSNINGTSLLILGIKR